MIYRRIKKCIYQLLLFLIAIKYRIKINNSNERDRKINKIYCDYDLSKMKIIIQVKLENDEHANYVFQNVFYSITCDGEIGISLKDDYTFVVEITKRKKCFECYRVYIEHLSALLERKNYEKK